MTSSRSGSREGGGRSVTRMPDVTSRRVNEKPVTMEFDPRTFLPIGAHATSFRSYLGVMAKYHVPIVATCWDDVPQVDKNLLWQDILNDTPCTKYKITKEEWVQFKESRLTPEWQDDCVDQQSQGIFVAQGREVLLVATTDDPTAPRVSTKGSCSTTDRTDYNIQYEFLVDMDPSRVVAVGRQIAGGQTIHGAPLLPTHARVYRPEKQPIAQPVNEAYEEAEDHDAISILTSRLNKLRKGPVEMLWELRTFGLECHVPLYINFDDAYEIIGGEKMLNIACIQLWCMKIKAELKSLIQIVVIRTRGQQLEIIYPKCNKKNDSWACGYYIMSWIKAIIRAEIRGEWIEVEIYI
ncbi:hypothetical protein LR48_Vigan07g206300 [Vigna angularis]|uniref:Ubiquitin-like protease family profile domain-containing protein n=1 Tax=Phaseolus angularis TaxID=3914 RepID=A0A0L9V0S3_PHAAN|nr:hypothetical protein LR48_Vigan07g206300 [Vigna angularis]